MRKATATLLAAGVMFAVAGGRVAQAADRAGIGVEWGIGPVIQLGDFDMKMSQGFGVTWQVTEAVGVAIFGENAPLHAEYTYSNDTGAVAFDQGVQVDGDYAVSGMRITHQLPVLKILDVGFELGVVQLNETNVRWHNSNGTLGSDVDFNPAGGNRDTLNTTGAMEGITASIGLFKAETGTVTTELSVAGALRFVQLPDTYIFGNQELNTTKPAAEKDEIEPIDSYSNLAIRVALNVGF